ncbi:MAG: CxxC-x17-CxxC domain-containing protein [Phycisphaerae bacterium]
MNFEDKTLVCVECQAEFVHSADEQQRWSERGYTQEPKRCAACRAKRRASGGGGSGGGGGGGGGGGFRGGSGGGGRDRGGPGGGGPKQFHPATCAACGKQTTVPFKPTEGRPVYCRDCFQSNRRG